MPLDPPFLDAIKKFEGYTPKASWDYRQHSIGYGTKARFPGETIDQAEADRRFQQEIGSARGYVRGLGVPLQPGQEAALTSLTFNAGPGWINSGLGQAVRSGNWDEASRRFVQYNKAGGQVLPGLQSRRNQEVAWLGGNVPAASASPTSPTMTTGAAPAMANSYSGWTPESTDFAKKFGAQQMKEGIDSSPVGHWTQAIARVLQAGSGAAWNQQGLEGERAGNARVSDIYAKGLANNDPVPKIAASMMGDAFGRQEGQALAKQHMATQASQGFQTSQQNRQFQHAEQMQAGSQAHATRQAQLGHQLQIRLINAKSEMERKELLEKGRALGLLPPEGGAPSMPQAPGAAPGAAAPMPQGVPQQSAAPADPYQALVQPTIPKAQQEAEMRRRAGQTLLMGDPKGAAKIMAKEDDPKEYQTKDALWAERMARSEITMRGNIGTPDKPTYNPGNSLNRFWPDDGVLGMANSEKWKAYQAGAREWIAALLRKDTGAAVTETEWKLYFPTYFPQPGENATVQNQKLERRIAEARKLRASSGPVFDRMNPNFDTEMGQRLQQQNAGVAPKSAGQPRRVNSVEEAMSLPSGTQFMTPDGRLKVRP